MPFPETAVLKEALTQKKINQMNLEEKFRMIYGNKFPYDHKFGVDFIRLDAQVIENRYDHSRNQVIPKKQFRFSNRVIQFDNPINYKGFNVDVTIPKSPGLKRNDKGSLPVESFKASPFRAFSHSYTRTFHVHNANEYYAIMLHPRTKHLRELKDERGNPVVYGLEREPITFEISDPNAEAKKENINKGIIRNARLKLAEIEKIPGHVRILARMLRFPVQQGATVLTDETLSITMEEVITMKPHNPPHNINADVFMAMLRADDFKSRVLAQMAQSKGVVAYDNSRKEWDFNEPGPEGIKNKVFLARFEPARHQNDTHLPLIIWLQDTSNAVMVERIKKACDYRDEPHNPAKDMSEMTERLTGKPAPEPEPKGDVAEFAEIKYLRDSLKELGVNAHTNAKLSTLRDRADENGIAPFAG